MKRQLLQPPFKWADRKILLQDHVLYVPDQLTGYADFHLPTWASLFGNDHRVHVEYCSGNGAWIVDKALANPSINWVAVELKFERVRQIWAKLKSFNLSNLLIICGEAKRATSYYIPDGSVENIYINFPDPWPKKRHWKHRLLQDLFFKEMARILISGGKVTFVTDDVDYSEVVIRDIRASGCFISAFDVPFYKTELAGYGNSFFESLWRSKGKPIRYHQWLK
jgi:tRNA (guanine-N7-)-methyltransferase